MLTEGSTKLKNQSWRQDTPLFWSGLLKTVDFGKITNDQPEIFLEGFCKDSYGRVMLHGGPAKLKNQSWRHDIPLFRSGLPKTDKFGTITNDHQHIFLEGFGKDSRGHLLNSNPLRNRRSEADYESVCKHLNFWEGLMRKLVENDLGKVLVFRFISFRFVSQTLLYSQQILIFQFFLDAEKPSNYIFFEFL
jgi:hypothetical protein